MNKINWAVRAKNKAFWIAIIPTIFLLISQVMALFGISVDFSGLSKQLIDIVETVFVILAIIGVVVDPTTKGLSDSTRALGYEYPRED